MQQRKKNLAQRGGKWRTPLLFETIDASRDAIPQSDLPEVEKVAKLETGQPQLCQHLFLMHRQDPLDGF